VATTILAQGTPMLAAGDEIGHTQRGNNNPYCQDNEITWLDWDQADHDLAGFVAHVAALRSRLLPFGAHWYSGQAKDDGHPDLGWLRRTGDPLTPEDWENRMSRVLGVRIGAPGRSPDPLLLLLNGGADDAEFALPAGAWMCELDSTTVDGRSAWRRGSDDHVVIPARGLLLLRDAADHTMHQDAAT
jgi:glycogen debranching enzyme